MRVEGGNGGVGHSSQFPGLVGPTQVPWLWEDLVSLKQTLGADVPEERQHRRYVGAAGFGWAVPGAVTNPVLFLNARQATDDAISCEKQILALNGKWWRYDRLSSGKNVGSEWTIFGYKCQGLCLQQPFKEDIITVCCLPPLLGLHWTTHLPGNRSTELGVGEGGRGCTCSGFFPTLSGISDFSEFWSWKPSGTPAEGDHLSRM